MKNTLTLCLAMCLSGAFLNGCGTTLQTTDAVTSAKPAMVVDAREIVALVTGEADKAAMLEAGRNENYTLRKITELPSLDLIMISFDMEEGVTGKQAIAALEGAVPASTVGVNHAFMSQQTSRASAGLNYANALMGWPVGGCPALGPVGVIDTGVDATAPGLAAAKIISKTFFEGRAGSSRHGTEVATVLADPDRLQNVTIHSANVFEQSPDAGLAAGADALVRALDWMAQNNVRVVNLALAGPYNKLLDLAVRRAAAQGLILVAAVGNAGPNVPPQFPAGFSEVIAVTAVDANSQIMPNAVRGSHVDIAAPGVDVLVASGSSQRLVTGTSIASPFVAARIVADPRLMASPDVEGVRRLLKRSASDLGARGSDPLFGAGLLKAEGICTTGRA